MAQKLRRGKDIVLEQDPQSKQSLNLNPRHNDNRLIDVAWYKFDADALDLPETSPFSRFPSHLKHTMLKITGSMDPVGFFQGYPMHRWRLASSI